MKKKIYALILLSTTQILSSVSPDYAQQAQKAQDLTPLIKNLESGLDKFKEKLAQLEGHLSRLEDAQMQLAHRLSLVESIARSAYTTPTPITSQPAASLTPRASFQLTPRPIPIAPAVATQNMPHSYPKIPRLNLQSLSTRSSSVPPAYQGIPSLELTTSSSMWRHLE